MSNVLKPNERFVLILNNGSYVKNQKILMTELLK